MNTIEEQWENIGKRIIPPTASEVQRREMRKAFYAGAIVMLRLVQDMGREDVSENEVLRRFDELVLEAKDFVDDVLITEGRSFNAG